MKPILSIKNLKFQVPGAQHCVLNGIHLEMKPGDFLILLGSNGSGKSSLMRLVLGLDQPSAGQILCKGENLLSLALAERASLISSLSQDPSMTTFDGLTVYENCLMAQQRPSADLVKNSVQQRDRAEFKEYLKDYHSALPRHMDTEVGSLSGGERQSLALALCFLRTPHLLLLDEHTSALDPKTSALIMERTADFIAQNRVTTIMTTHKIEHALTYGNRLAMIQRGHLQELNKDETTTESIWSAYEKSYNPFTLI